MTSASSTPPAGASGAAPTATGGLGRRFLARLLDAILVGLAASALLAAAGLPAPTWGLGGTDAWVRSAVTGLLWFAYYVGFEATRGATLGKRLLGLRVVAPDGGAPGVRAAAVRNVWILLGLVPLIGGVAQLVVVVVIAVTIARNEHHRGAHDHLAGTAVVT